MYADRIQIDRNLFQTMRNPAGWVVENTEEKQKKMQILRKCWQTAGLKVFLPGYVPKDNNKYAFI